MGRLRLSAFKQHQTADVQQQNPYPVSKTKEKEDSPQHIKHVEHVELNDTAYPIRPKQTKENDLPQIPASKVKDRDGRDGRRLWIVVDTTVLDVTEYQSKHPGGRTIIAGFGGQDCSWQWWSFHNREIWQKIATGLRVGRTKGVPNPYQRPATIVGLRKHGFDDW